MNFPLGLEHGALAAAGVAAAVVPILLHLLLRQQPKRVVFPALRLLRNRRVTAVRRLRLRHIILLILRCLLLALFGLAVAHPKFTAGAGFKVDEDAAIAGVLVVDTSPSMELKNQGKTRLEAALEQGQKVLDKLNPESEIIVMDSGVPTTHAPVKVAAASDRLKRLAIQPGQRPLNEALVVALRAVAKTTLPRAEVYVLTDRAAHAWTLSESASLKSAMEQVDAGVSVYVLDVGVESPRNVSMSLPKIAQQVFSAGGDLSVDASLFNFGPDRETIVELTVDGQTRDQRTMKLGRDQASELKFDVGGLAEGVHQGVIRARTGDPLPFDDERYFTVEVRPAIRMLVVAESMSETRNWTFAVNPPTGPRASEEERRKLAPLCKIDTLLDPKQLAGRDLAGVNVVCLLNAGGIPPAGWDKLKEFAESGGGIFVSLGDRVDVPGYNGQAAQSVLPGKLNGEVRKQGQPVFLSADRLAHPVLAKFKELGANDFSRGFIDRYWKVDPSPASVSIMPLTNGDAGLLERGFGGANGGKCILLTTAAHYTPVGYWSELPRTFAYIVVAEQVTRYLSGAGEVSLNHVVGAAPLVELPKSGPFSQLAVTDPKKEVQKLANDDPQVLTVRAPATKLAGNYIVESTDAKKPLVRGFSANIPESESNLDYVDPDALKKLLPDGKLTVAKDFDALQRTVSENRTGKDLFPYVMLLLLVAVCVEGWLANRFYKPITPVGEGL